MVSWVRLDAFDRKNKFIWFGLDLEAFGTTWVICLIILAVGAGSLQWFGLMSLDRLYRMVAGVCGPNWAILVGFLMPAIVAFAIVFIFRCNIHVRGTRRPFRYFCPWL